MAYDLDDFVENVTELIEKPEKKFTKSPRYQSIHRERTRAEVARLKSGHKTLGQPRVPPPRPSEFLRKGSGRPEVPGPRPPRRRCCLEQPASRLPAWTKAPRRARTAGAMPRDPAGEARADFRRRNVELAKGLRPKSHEPRSVDTRRGDVQRLVPSGLVPTYVYKKNFGEVPSYIHKLKSAIIPKSEDITRSVKKSKNLSDHASLRKNACRYVTEDERAQILGEMKKKWSEIMKRFQCLPFLIDTPPKIKRKHQLEEKLRRLEKDIELMENNRYIYVYDDSKIKF